MGHITTWSQNITVTLERPVVVFKQIHGSEDNRQKTKQKDIRYLFNDANENFNTEIVPYTVKGYIHSC